MSAVRRLRSYNVGIEEYYYFDVHLLYLNVQVVVTASESGSILLFSHKLAPPDPRFHLLSEYQHRS
jgi:hypothetical protein